ncbi:MAG: phosphatidylglycerophosphatase A [Bdellovibrionota bacterium]
MAVRKRIIEALATGFYLGKIPFMPGTWGTLAGIPAVLLLAQLNSDIGYMVGVVVLILVASFVAELYEREHGGHDPGEIVIDEVAGYAVAMTMLPQTWQAYLAAFIVFRIIDIFKPYPINRIDQRVKGGLGTVLDDVAAGLVANVILQIIYTKTNWLGEILNAS